MATAAYCSLRQRWPGSSLRARQCQSSQHQRSTHCVFQRVGSEESRWCDHCCLWVRCLVEDRCAKYRYRHLDFVWINHPRTSTTTVYPNEKRVIILVDSGLIWTHRQSLVSVLDWALCWFVTPNSTTASPCKTIDLRPTTIPSSSRSPSLSRI